MIPLHILAMGKAPDEVVEADGDGSHRCGPAPLRVILRQASCSAVS
jgi:hypothetical protein